MDGLATEREQGITIDVAYHLFSTDKRTFIVADTPELYTRNMVTGVSTVDAAILVVDAHKGILTQPRRHSFLMSLIGIRHIVVVINKVDLMDCSEVVFNRICDRYCQFAEQLDLEEITFIPMSVLKGDNISLYSNNTPWYQGASLMGYLETVEVDNDHLQRNPFRMRVQWESRPSSGFRGFSGTLASGIARLGDEIRVLPSGKANRIERTYTHDGDLEQAVAGQSVALMLQDEIDISCVDVISSIDSLLRAASSLKPVLSGCMKNLCYWAARIC